MNGGVRPIRAKSVLIKRKSLDPWFISRAGMNLYRGCAHDCAYCDGRSENYRVEGDFAREVEYKENAPEILARELDPRRKRKPFRPGYLFIGGGICDSWQPAEKELELTRRVLELIAVFPYPLLLLTKSSLILRDLDLLVKLNRNCRVTVAVSLSSVDEELSGILEPGASPPSERLEVIHRAKAAGLGAGVMLLPVVPLVTDTPQLLDASYRACRDAGADFVACGPMTLKKGRQWDHFMRLAESRFPEAAAGYQAV
jgi:DNA repair photolyase